MAENWVTGDHIAEVLGMGPYAVRALLLTGQIPAVRDRQRWLVKEADFEAWLAGHDSVGDTAGGPEPA